MCDAYTPAGEPIPTNKRFNAAKIFSNPAVAAEEPWYFFFSFSAYSRLQIYQLCYICMCVCENPGMVLSKNTLCCARRLTGQLVGQLEASPDLR